MRKFLLAFLPILVLLGSAEPATAGSASIPTNPERPEHVTFPTLRGSPVHRSINLPADYALAQKGRARLGTPSRILQATSAATGSNQFLTRPYTTWHTITSVFDHCNPDYTTDGRVCEFDGSIGLKTNGVDPSFSLGYAQTRGAGDYLYYDGHNGWDYALAYENVLAAGDGTVQVAGSDSINACFGQTIILNHPGGFSTRYAHLASIYVSPGQSVSRGQVIALSGNSGCSSGAHLHFGVYATSSWTAIDPWGWSGPGADPWPSDAGNLWLTGTAQFPLPWAPTAVTAVPGDSSASVSWTAPGFDGGTPIAKYQVTASPGGATVTVNGTQTSAVMTGLTSGASYSFTVTAIDSVGGGPASAPSNTVTLTAVPLPPTAVHGSPSSGSAVVTWAPNSPGTSPITGYSVTSSPGGITVDAGTATTAIVRGLANGTTYTFTVSARNALGTSAASAASNLVTPLAGTSWQPLSGVITSSPAVATTGPGRLSVFARGTDMQLWERSYGPAGWGNWLALGGVVDSNPTVVSQANGALDVFIRGTDQQLWHRAFNGSTWAGWEPLGGTLGSSPAVSSWAAGRLDVFVRGTDDGLWHLWYDGSRWSDWEPLGGVFKGDPAAVSWGANRIDVFVRGADDAEWHRAFNPGAWSDWDSLGAVLASSPTATSWGPGRLDTFIRGTDNHLWHDWFDGTSWGGWKLEDANAFTYEPAVVSWGPGRLDVFVRGLDTGLWRKAFD